MKSWLLDTGPLVAYLDASDPFHDRTVSVLDRFSGQFFTTGAVITETMHFVSAVKTGPRLLAEFVLAAGVEVYDLAQVRDLHQAVVLMEQYSDTPMDYADATLVLLAERLEVYEIATLDRRGFSTFRTSGGKPFVLVLDQDVQAAGR